MTTNTITTTGDDAPIVPYDETPIQVAGVDASDLAFPRATLFQAMPTQNERYGDLALGTLFAPAERKVLVQADKPFQAYKFTVGPLCGWKQYVARSDDGSVLYVTRSKDEVDPADLKRGSGAGGVGCRAKITYCYICIVDGFPTPYLIEFRGSSVWTGRQILTSCETRRVEGLPMAAYEIGVDKASNERNVWSLMSYATVVDGSEDLMASVKKWRAVVNAARSVSVVDDDDTVPFDEGT
jgi:hypothetical protein